MTGWSVVQIAFRQLSRSASGCGSCGSSWPASTFLLVLLQALEQGVTDAQKRAVTQLLSGDVNVGGYFKVHPDAILPVITDAPRLRSVVEPLVPADCALRERGRGYAVMWAGRYRSNSFVVGVDPEREASLFRLLGPLSGSLEGLSQPRSIAVSSRLAERLRVQLGDVVTFFVTTTGGQRNALDGRVVAITRSVGLLGDSSGVVASNAFMRELYGYRPDAVGALQLSCGSTDVEPLAERVRTALRDSGYPLLAAERLAWADKMAPLLREGWSGQKVDVSTWEDEASFLEFVRSGLQALTGLLQLVVLVITMGGLFVSMSVAVRERTREIGTMRAIGMGRSAVLSGLVLEGAFTGAATGVLGAGVAVLACLGLGDWIEVSEELQTLLFTPTLGLDIVPARVVSALVLVTVGAAVGTLVPAVRAAYLSPRSAMESVQ